MTQLDGTEFKLAIEDVVECDLVMRVPGKGMPKRSGRGFGDIYVTFEVDFPDKLSVKQKEVIRKTLTADAADSEL